MSFEKTGCFAWVWNVLDKISPYLIGKGNESEKDLLL